MANRGKTEKVTEPEEAEVTETEATEIEETTASAAEETAAEAAETEAEPQPEEDNEEEEIVVKKMDATPAPKKPVRVVEVRSHPEIDESNIGKKSHVEPGVVVGQELTLEQINRFHRKAEKSARDEDPVTRAEMKRMTRRRGRSLR